MKIPEEHTQIVNECMVVIAGIKQLTSEVEAFKQRAENAREEGFDEKVIEWFEKQVVHNENLLKIAKEWYREYHTKQRESMEKHDLWNQNS